MVGAEVLSPAGNLDHFRTALAAGADSVYVGLKKFSARPDIWSFSIEQKNSKYLVVH